MKIKSLDYLVKCLEKDGGVMIGNIWKQRAYILTWRLKDIIEIMRNGGFASMKRGGK